MWKWIIVGLFVLTYVTGVGNYVSALIYRVNGTWSTAYVDGYGEAVAATLGPGAPLPEWMPQPSGAVIVSASRSVTGIEFRQFATVEAVTTSSKIELDRFYTAALEAVGFVIVKRDAEAIDPRTAWALGVDGTIEATHPAHGWQLRVDIRSASGWILPSRMVQVAWWDRPLVPRHNLQPPPSRP